MSGLVGGGGCAGLSGGGSRIVMVSSSIPNLRISPNCRMAPKP